MVKLKSRILKQGITWHSFLSWTGGIALLLFALSGISHPIMTWTGPKSASFFPPQMTMTAETAAAIPEVLQRYNIERALIVKAVPSENGSLLQVTEDRDKARRYFTLPEGEELSDYDAKQAQWLARYYTGLKDAPIKEVVFQTEFDNAYPWVNRLLPVYKITFDTDDNRTAFIYTELNAQAGLTNDLKTAFQSFFRAVHTWNWLDGAEHARVILMSLLLLSLFGMAATGTAMIFLMKNRKMERKRKIHRFISYAVWLPLLMFSSSGIYHLLQYAYGERHRGMQTGEQIAFAPEKFGDITEGFALYEGVSVNGMSIVEAAEGALLYRLSIPQGRPGQNIEKAKRFDGVPIEKPAIYLDARTGAESELTDKDMALRYAGAYGFPQEKMTGMQLITRFGPHYDFRNKRLPVWQIDYATKLGDKIFVDPATGILIDRLTDKERYEGYSFSLLHKWNFLTPFTGRTARDMIIVVTLLAAVVMTVLGYIMLLKNRKRRKG